MDRHLVNGLKKSFSTRQSKKKRHGKARKIVKEEISRLFEFARQVAPHNPKIAREIIITTRKMAMKIRFPIPHEYKQQFCRKCNTPYITRTVRIRVGVHHPHVTYSCLICGHTKRFPYRPKRVNMNNRQ